MDNEDRLELIFHLKPWLFISYVRLSSIQPLSGKIFKFSICDSLLYTIHYRIIIFQLQEFRSKVLHH
jgi:hypothetical protein